MIGSPGGVARTIGLRVRKNAKPGTSEGLAYIIVKMLAVPPEEFSFYVSEHYRWDDNRLRRLAVRKHGFASVSAGYEPGEMTTRPIVLEGDRLLLLNYSTAAAGSIQVEVQDEFGQLIEGLALSDMEALYGDNLAEAVQWRTTADLSAWRGQTVRFRFVLQDADLFAMRIAGAS